MICCTIRSIRPFGQSRFLGRLAGKGYSTCVSQTDFDRATFTIRDGPVFHGKSLGANTNVSGEAVISTGMVGYRESMTDPSYRY
jgi:carbamoyl-phosphate synthase small subunit